MIVSDKGGSNFDPHPEGQFPARCVDVIDRGWSKGGQYGPKYQVCFVYYAGEEVERDVDGKKVMFPLLVFSTFTATLSERGLLRPHLESWRGKNFTSEELEGFDTENVFGAPCFINVMHDPTGKYANIKTIMPLPSGMEAPLMPTYERMCDREDWEGPREHPDMVRSGPHGQEIPDEAYKATTPEDSGLAF